MFFDSSTGSADQRRSLSSDEAFRAAVEAKRLEQDEFGSDSVHMDLESVTSGRLRTFITEPKLSYKQRNSVKSLRSDVSGKHVFKLPSV